MEGILQNGVIKLEPIVQPIISSAREVVIVTADMNLHFMRPIEPKELWKEWKIGCWQNPNRD